MVKRVFAVALSSLLAASLSSAEVLGPNEEPPTMNQPGGPGKVEQVEVVNFPPVQQIGGTVSVDNLPDVQDVNVLNAQATPPRWQLVGFTDATVQPNLGIFGITRACQLEFPASRMCTREEVRETTRVPPLPPGVSAWVEDFDFGVVGSQRCQGWTSNNTGNGTIVDSDGKVNATDCSSFKRLACCALVED